MHQVHSFATWQQTVIYVVDRYTSSRCWRGLNRLAAIHQPLRRMHTAVLIVGDKENLASARRLAREMALPFKMTDGAEQWLPPGVSERVLLLDSQGVIRYDRRVSRPQTAVHEQPLLTAVRRSRLINGRTPASDGRTPAGDGPCPAIVFC